MKLFFLNLWHDLREKRLWPVAALLLLALVAVPVLLAKPAPEDDGDEAAVAVDVPNVAGSEIAQLPNEVLIAGSDLDVFKAKDPFAPNGVTLPGTQEGTDVATAADALSAAGGSGGGSGGGDDKSGGGGSGGGSGGGGGGGTSPGSPGGGAPTVSSFTYVADVSFASNGKVRKIKGLSRLDMLPSQSSPLLLFLGVDESAGSAVFLVDSTLKGTGEGTCSPSPSDCGVLALGAGSEHEFVDEDGNSYAIRIDEIRRLKVSKASASKRKVATSSRRRFKPRILTDLVTETISTRGGSSPDSGGR